MLATQEWYLTWAVLLLLGADGCDLGTIQHYGARIRERSFNKVT